MFESTGYVKRSGRLPAVSGLPSSSPEYYADAVEFGRIETYTSAVMSHSSCERHDLPTVVLTCMPATASTPRLYANLLVEPIKRTHNARELGDSDSMRERRSQEERVARMSA